MPVTFSVRGDTLTACLSGELDHHSASLMRAAIDEMVESCLPETLELDFEKLSFMDSSGIGLVMGRYRTMAAAGGKLCLINLSPHLKKLMQLGGITCLPVSIR